MNRKTFLASLAGLVAMPSIIKTKKPEQKDEYVTCQAPPTKIVGVVIPDCDPDSFFNEMARHDASVIREKIK